MYRGIGNKYYALFSCGHKGYIYYHGRSDLYNQLAKAESSGLCPICKMKQIKENNVLVEMSYGEFIEKYNHKRGVIKGEYNKDTKKIKVYLPNNLAKEFFLEKERIYYDAEVISHDDNNNIVIALFIKGNSFKIKDTLKQMDYRWKNNRWQKEIVVFPTLLDGKAKEKWLSPQRNPEFHSEIKKLTDLGCIDNLISLNFDNI